MALQTYKTILHFLRSRKHSGLFDWPQDQFEQFVYDVLAMVDLNTIYQMGKSAYVRYKYQSFIFNIENVGIVKQIKGNDCP